jgi:uncharacterized membrane protein YhaH (DUF805 family)
MEKQIFSFTSAREKRLWLWALLVIATILASLFIGNPLATQLRDQNVQAVFFVLGMLIIAAAVIVHGLRDKPGKIELSVLLGIVAIYVMFFLRLGILERSHLIEYSVLSIFIHKALLERKKEGKNIAYPALLASAIAISVGILDECIQYFLPNRVFDLEDIVFNCMAVVMAIGSSLLLKWVYGRVSKAKNKT